MLSPKAILISGSESHFKEEMLMLAKVIEPACGGDVTNIAYPNRNTVLSAINQVFEDTKAIDPILIAFSGHGNKRGWESSGLLPISYRAIVKAISKYVNPVLILNATCYGQFLIKHLIGKRSCLNTGVVTSWDGDDESFASVVPDATESWSQGETLEDMVRRNEYEGRRVPVQQRWGIYLDHHFFPPKT